MRALLERSIPPFSVSLLSALKALSSRGALVASPQISAWNSFFNLQKTQEDLSVTMITTMSLL